MGLHSWLIAQSYELVLRRTERLCLGRWRRELLANARGEILEIGAGTGHNLSYYPTTRANLILSEPDRQMRRKLQQNLASGKHRNVQIYDWPAEQIGRPDQSFDTVVSSLVLCSVSSQQQALEEVVRLLRPGGQFLFLEHIAAAEPMTIRWQKFIEPFWKRCSGNCHLTRDTLQKIITVGLQVDLLQEDEIVGAPAILRRTIRGRARKPSP